MSVLSSLVRSLSDSYDSVNLVSRNILTTKTDSAKHTSDKSINLRFGGINWTPCTYVSGCVLGHLFGVVVLWAIWLGN